MKGSRRLAILIGCALCITSAQVAGQPAQWWEGIRYIERPEAGPYRSEPHRSLSSSGRSRYGIDINSEIDIKVDSAKLSSASTQAMRGDAATVAQLTARLKSLENAVASLDREARNVAELFTLWNDRKTAEFNTKRRESARARSTMFAELYRARRLRLEESGLSAAAADQLAQDAFTPALSGPAMEHGYDWARLRALFDEEITLTAARLRQFDTSGGNRLAIEAHLVARGKPGVPVRLPRYNTIGQAAEVRYEKLRFDVSPEERTLYAQYDATAKTIGDAKDVGEAVTKALEAQYLALRSEIVAMARAATKAGDDVRAKAQTLERWKSADNRRAWLQSVQAALAASPQGKNVLKHWDDLSKILDQTTSDLEALKAYADIQGAVEGKSPPDAIESILKRLEIFREPSEITLRILDAAVWAARVKQLQDFGAAVEALEPGVRTKITAAGGPYADMVALRDALVQFVEAIKDSGKQISAWIAEVVLGYRPNRTAANLPRPEGATSVAIAPGARLDTSINLRELHDRKEGDELWVRYFISRGDKRIDEPWTDTFKLRTFGWSSQTLASLAFTKQSGTKTWRPTAAMNWILYRDSWPGDRDDGRGGDARWFSGAGISVMPLNPPEDNAGLQLGLGATVAFLDNRILLGGGANLQASENRGFLFISIRVVEFPALSGPLPGR